MTSIKQDERGTGHLEMALLVVVVALIGFVGWYVYRAKQTTDKALNTASSTSTGAEPRFTKNTNKNSTASSAATSNASLQSDLQGASSAANQGNKDMSATTSSLGDQSTFTSVPQ